MTPKQDDGTEKSDCSPERRRTHTWVTMKSLSLHIQHSHLQGQEQETQMLSDPLKRYLETSHSQIVEQMADTGQKEVRPCSLSLTDSAAAQKTVTEDAFLDALQTQQMKLEDNNGLLAELAHIEHDLRERLRIHEERQRELERIRREENHQRWRSLCFLILNQRTAKPWVTSYYKNIPMHIYCLPIETANHQKRKKKKKKECN